MSRWADGAICCVCPRPKEQEKLDRLKSATNQLQTLKKSQRAKAGRPLQSVALGAFDSTCECNVLS